VDEELKKAAYLGLNLVDFEDHFPPEYATMQEVTTTSFAFPSTTSKDVLSEVLRQGAQAMLTGTAQTILIDNRQKADILA